MFSFCWIKSSISCKSVDFNQLKRSNVLFGDKGWNCRKENVPNGWILHFLVAVRVRAFRYKEF